MNKIVVILTIALVIGLTSCTPPQSKPQPPSVISVLDFPEMAYAGDYVTVRVKVSRVSGERYYLDVVLHETSNPDDTIWEQFGHPQYPDDNLIVSWYTPVPKLNPGSYIAEITALGPSTGGKHLSVLRRNLIIK